MKIEYIKKCELADFASNALTEFEGEVPINIPRALSQSKNPFADADDVIMIVARDGKKLISYIGILPCAGGRNGEVKIYWAAGWRAIGDCPSSVSRGILMEMNEICGGNLSFPDLGEYAGGIIRKLGFELQQREGRMIRIRKALHQRSKIKSYRGQDPAWNKILRLSGSFRLLDFLSLPAQFRHDDNPGIKPDSIESFGIEKIDEISSFISEHSKDFITSLSPLYFKWLSESKWLLPSSSLSLSQARRYYFSSMADSFSYHVPVVKYKDEIVAAGLISVRDGICKIIYRWNSPEYNEIYVHALMKWLMENRQVHTIISADSEFVRFIDRSTFRYAGITNYKRLSSVGNPELSGFRFSDGDGDYPFC